MDTALALKLRESVDWDRILRSPSGESSFRFLQEHRVPRQTPGRPPSGTWRRGQAQTGRTYPTMLLVDTLLDSMRPDRPRREPRRGWRKLSEG